MVALTSFTMCSLSLAVPRCLVRPVTSMRKPGATASSRCLVTTRAVRMSTDEKQVPAQSTKPMVVHASCFLLLMVDQLSLVVRAEFTSEYEHCCLTKVRGVLESA